MLANPSYAGVYVFGRYQSAKQVGSSGEIITRSRPMPQDSWRVMIRDHHEGYIDWDQFVTNRHRLAANRTNAEGLPGPAREGLCLLQGLLICGRCGRRLTVRYTGNDGVYPIYNAAGDTVRTGTADLHVSPGASARYRRSPIGWSLP